MLKINVIEIHKSGEKIVSSLLNAPSYMPTPTFTKMYMAILLVDKT